MHGAVAGLLAGMVGGVMGFDLTARDALLRDEFRLPRLAWAVRWTIAGCLRSRGDAGYGLVFSGLLSLRLLGAFFIYIHTTSVRRSRVLPVACWVTRHRFIEKCRASPRAT